MSSRVSRFSHVQFDSPSKQSSHQDLQKAFKSLDSENQGKIKKSVILSATMYTSDYYDRQIIAQQLQKCPDQITFEQFTAIFELATVYKQDTSASWLFKLYDKDGKGYIDRNDLIRSSQITGIELTEQQIAQMLKPNNKMTEGKVDFDDFAQIMNTKIQFQ